jgi:hypothetical protein
MNYRILCTVRGGVTGPRQAYLSDQDGDVIEFPTKAEADAEAAAMRASSGPYSCASFTYTVEPVHTFASEADRRDFDVRR